MAGAGKNAAAPDKWIEAMEENLGKVLNEQQQQKLVNQQQARVVGDVRLLQNEMMRKLDLMMGNIDSGKGSTTPNSGMGTPQTNTGNKNPTRDGSSGSGFGSGAGLEGPELVFGSFNGTNQGKGRFEYRYRKIDMPAFDGKDPDGWILQAERYFAIYQLLDGEKVEAAVLSLNRDALSWFRWSDK